MWPTDQINRVVGKYQRIIARRLKLNTYELDGQPIVRHQGPFRSESIDLACIERWQIIPEMTFDLVLIELKNGTLVKWFDEYDDLLGIMQHVAWTKIFDV
jgi:hypothetical protein